MRRRAKRVHIYGMFVGGECRYVGASLRPSARAHHLVKRRKLAGAELRILESATPCTAGRAELRWIKKMWREGHRLINERLTPYRPR